MSKIGIIIGAVIVLLVIGALVLRPTGGTEEGEPRQTYATVLKDYEQGAKIYDVRTAQEYAEGHFEQALNWPVEKIQAGELPDAPKDAKIFVYCRSGNRSSIAASTLKDKGYTNVIDLGGLTDVQAIGGKLVR